MSGSMWHDIIDMHGSFSVRTCQGLAWDLGDGLDSGNETRLTTHCCLMDGHHRPYDVEDANLEPELKAWLRRRHGVPEQQVGEVEQAAPRAVHERRHL